MESKNWSNLNRTDREIDQEIDQKTCLSGSEAWSTGSKHDQTDPKIIERIYRLIQRIKELIKTRNAFLAKWGLILNFFLNCFWGTRAIAHEKRKQINERIVWARAHFLISVLGQTVWPVLRSRHRSGRFAESLRLHTDRSPGAVGDKRDMFFKGSCYCPPPIFADIPYGE